MTIKTHGSYQVGRKDTGLFWNRQSGTISLLAAGVTILAATSSQIAFSKALLPSADDTYDLGSSSAQWKDLYVDGVAYIDEFGEDLVPDTDDSHDIGSASAQWKDAYFDGTVFTDKFQLGDTAITGLVAGGGTSATPYELGATAGTALDFHFRGSHTTGDMRGMYLRLNLDGTAASSHGAEALRVFTEIEDVDVAVGGTVNAVHATMEIDGNSGNVDGAGNVIRATLGGSGTKTLTGTLSGVLIDLDWPSTFTLTGKEAAIRIGKAQDHEWPVAIAFDGIVGSGNAVEASTVTPTGNTTHGVHIQVDGTSVYLPGYASIAFGN